MRKILIVCICFVAEVLGQEYIVNQSGKMFLPSKLHVKVGDVIIFKNADSFVHNAYTDDKKNEFDIGAQKPGEDKRIEIKGPGRFKIECAIHPTMQLEIIAVEK